MQLGLSRYYIVDMLSTGSVHKRLGHIIKINNR